MASCFSFAGIRFLPIAMTDPLTCRTARAVV